MTGFQDFSDYCIEHNIQPGEEPAAFAAYLHQESGWDGPMREVKPKETPMGKLMAYLKENPIGTTVPVGLRPDHMVTIWSSETKCMYRVYPDGAVRLAREVPAEEQVMPKMAPTCTGCGEPIRVERALMTCDTKNCPGNLYGRL